MKVTVIGAGNMGRGIGTRAVAGGHEVEIVDRDPAEAQKVAEELGGSATALEPGAPFGGEVVVFAVYYRGIKDAVQQSMTSSSARSLSTLRTRSIPKRGTDWQRRRAARPPRRSPSSPLRGRQS